MLNPKLSARDFAVACYTEVGVPEANIARCADDILEQAGGPNRPASLQSVAAALKDDLQRRYELLVHLAGVIPVETLGRAVPLTAVQEGLPPLWRPFDNYLRPLMKQHPRVFRMLNGDQDVALRAEHQRGIQGIKRVVDQLDPYIHADPRTGIIGLSSKPADGGQQRGHGHGHGHGHGGGGGRGGGEVVFQLEIHVPEMEKFPCLLLLRHADLCTVLGFRVQLRLLGAALHGTGIPPSVNVFNALLFEMTAGTIAQYGALLGLSNNPTGDGVDVFQALVDLCDLYRMNEEVWVAFRTPQPGEADVMLQSPSSLRCPVSKLKRPELLQQGVPVPVPAAAVRANPALWVSGVPEGAAQPGTLRQLFQVFGTVETVVILPPKPGEAIAAVIRMAHADGAAAVMQAFNSNSLKSRWGWAPSAVLPYKPKSANEGASSAAGQNFSRGNDSRRDGGPQQNQNQNRRGRQNDPQPSRPMQQQQQQQPAPYTYHEVAALRAQVVEMMDALGLQAPTSKLKELPNGDFDAVLTSGDAQIATAHGRSKQEALYRVYQLAAQEFGGDGTSAPKRQRR